VKWGGLEGAALAPSSSIVTRATARFVGRDANGEAWRGPR
jgi:hypothetical protein